MNCLVLPRAVPKYLQWSWPCSGSWQCTGTRQIEFSLNHFRSGHSAANQITLFSSASFWSVSPLGANAVQVAPWRIHKLNPRLQCRQALEGLSHAEIFAVELYNKTLFVLVAKTEALFCLLLQRLKSRTEGWTENSSTLITVSNFISRYTSLRTAQVEDLWLGAVELWKAHSCCFLQKELRPRISNTQLPLNCCFKSDFIKKYLKQQGVCWEHITYSGNFLNTLFLPQSNFCFVAAWKSWYKIICSFLSVFQLTSKDCCRKKESAWFWFIDTKEEHDINNLDDSSLPEPC